MTCPSWCDGRHAPRYADQDPTDHFAEVGRLAEGDAQVIVGVAMSTGGEQAAPTVELLLLGQGGVYERPELLGGDVYLSPAEAEQLAPLLSRAAALLAGCDVRG